uniref:Uncharacterized protein n=1 Tax=Rhizophora mucronata TaxID=61149 RepID=A0A2P2QCW0_RHIMU
MRWSLLARDKPLYKHQALVLRPPFACTAPKNHQNVCFVHTLQPLNSKK